MRAIGKTGFPSIHAAAPAEACAACRRAKATHDMVFTTFYPILGRPILGRK